MVFGSMRHAAQQLRQSAKNAATRRGAFSASASFASAPRAAPAFVQARVNAAPIAAQPQHVRADPTGVVAGIAILGALIGVGKMWWDTSSSPSGAAEPLAFQELPQAEVALFFAELTAAVKELFKQLPELEKAVRQYLKENNQELSDEEFKQAILQNLYQAMENVEQAIVAKRRWSRQSLEYALEKFAQDPEIVKLQEDLNNLMQTVFPAPEAVEIPEDLTADKTLEILREMVAGMEKAMSDMLAHARSEGITDVVKAMEEFQHLYVEHVEQMTQAQMKANGISQQAFTAALQKYHTESEQFRQQVEQIYAQQAKTFKKMGLPVETQ
ncbi:Acyl-coenzyme A oxidase [Phytophthora cinnamomi]|uniref:Acyl-coenzyme A oxidase n=1 Tax=Phytophthora cinnamomi TaxID=4785 RepID=UPI003559970B|nr:Acyl-coenzyme A oxidase [Phytophthora cinnamomi]